MDGVDTLNSIWRESGGYQREVGDREGEGIHPRKISCVELIIHFLPSKFLKTVAPWRQDEIQKGKFLFYFKKIQTCHVSWYFRFKIKTNQIFRREPPETVGNSKDKLGNMSNLLHTLKLPTDFDYIFSFIFSCKEGNWTWWYGILSGEAPGFTSFHGFPSLWLINIRITSLLT